MSAALSCIFTLGLKLVYLSAGRMGVSPISQSVTLSSARFSFRNKTAGITALVFWREPQYLLLNISFVLHATCYMLHATCYMLHVSSSPALSFRVGLLICWL